MHAASVVTLGSLLGLTACAGERSSTGDSDVRHHVLARFDGADGGGEACRALVAAHRDRVVVFAQDADSARRLTGSAGPVPSAPDGARLVTIVDEAVAGPPGERSALVVAPTGAAAAVDIALLFGHGIAPPHRLALGARLRLPDGSTTTQPAPSDFVVELMRRQHSELLADTPVTDVVFRMGLVTLHDDPLDRLLREQATTASNRHRQLVLTARQAGGDVPEFERIAREFLTDGVRALLVRTDDRPSLLALAEAAAERNVALVVLDPTADCELGTCCIGADQYSLGQAAGSAVKALAPNGAGVIELSTGRDGDAAQLRHRGFVDALGLTTK